MKDDLRHGEDHSEVSEAVARLQQYHSCLERWLMASSEMWKWVLPFQATCPLKMKNLSHFLLCLLYEFSSSLPPPLANEWIYLVLVWYQHSESFSNEIFWSALDNGQWTADTRRYHSYPGSMHWLNSHLPKSIFTSGSRVSVFPSFDCWLNGTSWWEGLLPKNLVPYLPAPSKIPLE